MTTEPDEPPPLSGLEEALEAGADADELAAEALVLPAAAGVVG